MLRALAMPERKSTSLDPILVGSERAALSFLLSNNANAVAGVPQLKPELFSSPAHREIFGAIRDVNESGEAEVNVLTVTHRLTSLSRLEHVGGAAAVTSIALETSSERIFAYSLDVLRDAGRDRESVKIGERLAKGQIDATEAAEKLRALSSDESDFTIRTAGEVLALPRNEKSNLLGDRLLAFGQSLVIAGVGGIGKTRLLLQLLAALITGRAWCGIETHARNLRCLCLQTENSVHRLQDDLNALRAWTGKEWANVESNLLVHTLENDGDMLLSLADVQSARRLESVVRKYEPDIIAIDPLRDFAMGDLNSDADMSETLRALGRVCRAGNPDRALVILHHSLTGRAGAAKAFGLERAGFARNSKMLQTWARGMVNVIPGAEDDNSTLVLTCGKNSNGREFAAVAVRLNERMLYEVDEDFDVSGWREHVTSTKPQRATFGVELLRDVAFPTRDLTKKEVVKVIRDETGCGISRAYELVSEAAKRGFLRLDKREGTYAKT